MVKSYDASREAEQSVIGSLLIDARCLPEVMQLVTVDDFSVNECRSIFAAIRSMWLNGEAVDVVTVLEKLGRGYADRLRSIVDMTPTAANVLHYCRIVHDNRRLAALHAMALELLDTATLEDARRVYRSAETAAALNPANRRTSIQDGLGEWYKSMNDQTPPAYLDWGIKQLNENVKVSAGDFIVLGADSSVGKTAFAVQIAYGIAKSGKRVGIYSLETPAVDLYRRIVAQQAKIALPMQQEKMIGKTDWKAVIELMKDSKDMTLDIIDASNMMLDDLRGDILANRYDAVIVDYVQLFDVPGAHGSTEEVRTISKTLHKMAMTLGVIVIGLSQLTVPDTAPDKWVPTMDNLAESRQLKKDAKVVMLMYLSQRSKRSGMRTLDIVKNKEGRFGRIYLKFLGNLMTFRVDPRNKTEEGEP